MLVGQELRWFLLVLLRLNACGLCFGMVFVPSLAVWHKKRHDRVLLHACGRRGVASTLSTRKGTHFFADMQEKSHFSAIF